MKNRKINVLLLSSLFILTSCNNSNNESNNDTYKVDENKVLVKDFTLKDAKECVDIYYKFEYEQEDFRKNSKLDIYYYLGSYGNSKIVLMQDTGISDIGNDHNETIKVDQYDLINEEKIEDFTFRWHFDKFCVRNPRVYYQDNMYSITDAYNNKILSYNDLSILNDIWNNKRSEYKVFYRFLGENLL